MNETWGQRRERILEIMNRCGICGDTPMFNWSGRQGQLCKSCQSRAVDSNQQTVVITNGLFTSDVGRHTIGLKVIFANADPNTGEREVCAEVSQSGICWVDGIACKVITGRMGGAGLMVADFPQLRLGPEYYDD